MKHFDGDPAAGRIQATFNSWEAPRVRDGLHVIDRFRLRLALHEDPEQPTFTIAFRQIPALGDYLIQAAGNERRANMVDAAEALEGIADEARDFVALNDVGADEY